MCIRDSCQAGLLAHLPHNAGQRVLAGLKFAAYAHPFVMVDVIFLFHAVQHQVGTCLLYTSELAALETEAAENVEKIFIRMGEDDLL